MLGVIRRSNTRAEPLPQIIVPPSLVLDDNVRTRLTRALERSDRSIRAVGAEVSALAPGASFRVAAEWRALEASDLIVQSNRAIRGAAAVRPDTPYTVTEDSFRITTGRFLIDTGGHVHDPRGTTVPLSNALPVGRSPFPHRPTVCFLGLSSDEQREQWARRFVNRLTRLEIEARLLTPTGAPSGFHLTRPALPSPDSIAALEPDVVVTLDRASLDVAPMWCTRRQTTVIHFDPDMAHGIELISWELSKAQGRLRAHLGWRAQPSDLARLILRFAAGPQPAPPRSFAPRPPSPEVG